MKSNVILAASQHIAEMYREAFKLDPNDWSVANPHKSLKGWLFERIVIVRPHYVMSAMDLQAFDDQIVDAQARLDIGGELRVV